MPRPPPLSAYKLFFRYVSHIAGQLEGLICPFLASGSHTTLSADHALTKCTINPVSRFMWGCSTPKVFPRFCSTYFFILYLLAFKNGYGNTLQLKGFFSTRSNGWPRSTYLKRYGLRIESKWRSYSVSPEQNPCDSFLHFMVDWYRLIGIVGYKRHGLTTVLKR